MPTEIDKDDRTSPASTDEDKSETMEGKLRLRLGDSLELAWAIEHDEGARGPFVSGTRARYRYVPTRQDVGAFSQTLAPALDEALQEPDQVDEELFEAMDAISGTIEESAAEWDKQLSAVEAELAAAGFSSKGRLDQS